ncbi:hypothetical protein PAECIP111893_05320 [Paenibacillus plantiphilus]|uniref:Schlafen AlbA-2 domain-containing protein n=1 Tax=Paenibacillus plantiphilus TaxID=2905650 RepID=A0ABN8H7E9_9BACL|nr:ATP-binding protein [Paenibacillus plantiphilus]CAH1226058.1 hypothetical protein PAECIP111893_05320 [Paenibacillus plantiphilus]
MSTYNKKLDALTLEDIKQIEEVNLKEDQYHEFKGEMPHSDSFCAAITSLSNTYGGDFFLGIDAPEGGNVSLTGIPSIDSDKELLKFMNILQNGIEPKLPQVQTKVFEISENRFIYLFRVSRSWLRPHRVKNSGKFYARKSNGKFPMDVFELRQMFNEGSEFSNKVKQFREERAIHYMNRYLDQPFTLVHLIPVSSFENRITLDLSLYNRLKLAPIASAGWDPGINFNGIVSNAKNESIIQIFRNGIIEGFTIRLTRENKIPSMYFVEKISAFIHQSISNYQLMGVSEPFYITVSLFGVTGYRFAIDPSQYFDAPPLLSEDTLIFPEVFIENGDNIENKLNIIFDALWNAFGFLKYNGRQS